MEESADSYKLGRTLQKEISRPDSCHDITHIIIIIEVF